MKITKMRRSVWRSSKKYLLNLPVEWAKKITEEHKGEIDEIQIDDKIMLPHQKLIYPCPFCDEVTPEVIYRPSYKTAKRSQSAAAGSKTSWRRCQRV